MNFSWPTSQIPSETGVARSHNTRIDDDADTDINNSGRGDFIVVC